MPSFTVFKGNKDGQIYSATTERPELTGDQVYVKITASGLCFTDEHFRKGDIGLGHEGAAVVEEVGPAVKSLKKGDRVGWGYEHDACGECEWCLTGRETFCEKRAMYGYADVDQGSMGTHAVWREAFLFKIPEGLSDIEAAPLMCGGATVFNALRMYDIKPTDRVGVVGVGGLGHLAIQFASKMGCDTVVLSGTDSKKEEALKLGASEFIATKGKEKLEISKKVNVLLVTTSFNPDWNLVLPILSPDSIIFPLTVSMGDFSIPQMKLIEAGIRVQGSVVAPRWVHRQMLQFAALHKIKPIINQFTLNEEGITKAFQTLSDGNMRYRGVLVPQ